MKKSFSDGFSVLMAIYARDDPHLFEKAMTSVVANDLFPSQLVLVADGPLTENLENIIHTFVADYSEIIDVVRLKQNAGLAAALNYGMQFVKYDWIVRADADDINHNFRFSTLSNALKLFPDVDLLGSAIEEIDNNENVLSVRRVPIVHEDIVKFLKTRNPFNHMTVAYRTSMAIEAGGYPSVHLKEDYALWSIMIARGCRCMNLEDILVKATTGNNLYKRRGGWLYVKSEVDLQILLVQNCTKGVFSAFFYGSIRALVFILPSSFRKFIYLNFLRN